MSAPLFSPSPAPVSSPSAWLMVGGSRSLPPSWRPQVERFLSAAFDAGFGVSVGCAAGADALALSCALRLAPSPAWLRVFAVGSKAGGSPAVPLRARLLRRSLAALAGCSVAVCFLQSPGSAGSLRVAAAAADRGAQVFAFGWGFEGPPDLLAGCPGAWCICSLAGLPCWQWIPAQPSLF